MVRSSQIVYKKKAQKREASKDNEANTRIGHTSCLQHALATVAKVNGSVMRRSFGLGRRGRRGGGLVLFHVPFGVHWPHEKGGDGSDG